jgi:hypothetical protein
MKTKPYKYIILLTLAAIILVSLACNLPISGLSRNDEAGTLNTPLQSPETEQNNLDLSSVERFSYQVTEAQLSAILREGLASRPELGIREPVAYLRDGSIELSAYVERSGLTLPMTITMDLYIDSDNYLQYEITSAKLGPLPVPQAIMDQLSVYIDQSIEQSLGVSRDSVHFESVLVQNGVLSISGYFTR